MTKQTTIYLVAAALLALPAVSRADNSVSMRFANSFIPHAGYDAVSADDHLLQLELNYARRLYALWEGHLWAEASYMVGASQDEIFGQQLESRALLQSVTLGARYTYQLLAWLIPFARAGLGVGIGTLELEGDPVAGAVEDTAASFCGYLLVGVEVLLPLRRFRETGHGFTLGLVVEGGVAFASGLSFELGPEEDDELLQIPFESSSLGRINTSGGQVRVGLLARF